jgi:hypothetical protein
MICQRIMSSAAASTEAAFNSFEAVSLKPLLRYIATECVASMTPDDTSIVEFVIKLLNTNKEQLESAFRLGKNRLALPLASETKNSVSAMKESPAASIESVSNVPIHQQKSPRIATATDSPTDYTKCIALGGKRRDSAYMKELFERHKDVDGGLSQAAFIAALKEVEAPVLFSSDNASEDSLFLRADTNASGCVDQSECARPSVCETCEAFALIPPFTGSTSPPTCPTTLKCFSESTTSVYVQPSHALDSLVFHAPRPAVCRACSPSARAQRQRPAGWPGVDDCWPTGCRRSRKHRFFAGTTAQGAAAAC